MHDTIARYCYYYPKRAPSSAKHKAQIDVLTNLVIEHPLKDTVNIVVAAAVAVVVRFIRLHLDRV